MCLLINVLKAAGVSAETRELGREFQTATMRFEKKFLRIFNLVRGITRRRWWPLENGLGDGVKNVSGLIEEKPLTILKHMMRSATKRLCSKDFIFKLMRRSEYARSLSQGSRFVNERWTFSIALMRYIWEGDQTGEAYSTTGRM